MLKLDERVRSANRPNLAEWATSTLAMPQAKVQVRLRGNNLYLLCEGVPCPDVTVTVTRFARALAQDPIENLSPPDQPKIYQIFLSGRATGHNRPDWTVRLDPTQLDRYLEPEKPAPEASTPAKSKLPIPVPEAKALPQAPLLDIDLSLPEALKSPQNLVTERLAREGNPDAIARYLSEALSSLGVGIKVAVKEIPSLPLKASASKKRLWVWAESGYSPDPSLLAAPITERLRTLLEKRQGVSLEGFRDAVILGQVSGEARPEWILRVDLTPPEQMLKTWGRWGDVQAIALLLDRLLAEQEVRVRSAIKEATLYLFCSPRHQRKSKPAPDKTSCMAVIKPLLEELSPQGIQGTIVYGLAQEEPLENPLQEATPLWVDSVSLPASSNSALAETALELGKRGDINALNFLIDRLIHPNIQAKLTTGGAQTSVLQKGNLLHVITDAPVPPPQIRVGPPVVKFIRQLQIPGIEGVRVYGRRAGTKNPLWRYGADFAGRLAPKPETTPDFSPTSTELTDFLPQPGDLVLHPEIQTKEEKIPTLSGKISHALVWGMQQVLVGSQLFAPKNQLSAQATPHGLWIALIWGTLGFLVTIQADWFLGHLLKTAKLPPTTLQANLPQPDQAEPLLPGKTPTNNVDLSLPQLSLPRAKTEDDVFNSSAFTQGGNNITISGVITCAPEGQRQLAGGQVDPENCILEANKGPSFNSRQMDEQIIRYNQYLEEYGTPDILIVGSSRALRGIDPATLEKALKQQGYANLKIFNFGINGATAQVVDALLRQILPPEKLPRLVLWADGARAFNSGRQDLTYNAISISEGFRQVGTGKYPIASRKENRAETGEKNAAQVAADLQKSWVSSYQEISESLNAKIASASATYRQRQRLEQILGQTWGNAVNAGVGLTVKNQKPAPNTPPSVIPEASPNGISDANGFLRLAVRFNPSNYYKNHPRVAGSYDADYESFQLIGRQSAAFKNLREYLTANQINLVFINMPLTEDYLDKYRKNAEGQFRQYLLTLAAEQNFVFRDLSLVWPQQNEYFSDPSHLNRYGAFEVSQRLAQDPLIPWPSSPQKSPSNIPLNLAPAPSTPNLLPPLKPTP